ncbi:phage tail tube protein [Shinella sp. G-2]|uniref:phage tail tube protein n=1 Tax=Shinella sp. G-2 TaxID=3133141 RepID=UPI003D085A5F
MAERYVDNLAILCKIEANYGVSAAPTGAANAMVLRNVTYEPLAGQDIELDRYKPYMGHQGIFLTGDYCRLRGEFDIAGSGVAGTAPACSPLLRSCGLQEVIDAVVDVQYSPVSKLFESSTIFYNDDGVNHVMLGVRGKLTASLSPGGIPSFTVEMIGLLGTFSDTALPPVNDSAWIEPVPVNKANTTVSLHGHAGACEGLTWDLGNTVEPRLLINQESIRQTGRKATGSAIFEATSLAEKNWIQIARARTLGALAAQHGTVAGNIVKFDMPKVQIGRPTYGETQRIRNNTLPLIIRPNAGNDELVITFK